MSDSLPVASASRSLAVGLLADRGHNDTVVEPGFTTGLKILLMVESSNGTVDIFYGTDTIVGNTGEFIVNMRLHNITSKVQAAVSGPDEPTATGFTGKLIPPISSIPPASFGTIFQLGPPYPVSPFPVFFMGDQVGGSPGYNNIQLKAWYNGTSQNCKP